MSDVVNIEPKNLEVRNLNVIQVLRGLFCLVVIITHITINSNDLLKKDFFFNFSLFGYAAVDFFFVLSGFMITYTSIKNAGRPDKSLIFIRRRLIKIFPIYWIVITIFATGQFFLRSYYNTPYEFNFWNIISTYFLFPGHIMINGVSWTLTHELYFYLLFLFFFFIPKKEWVFLGFFIYSILIISFTATGLYSHELQWMKLMFSPINIEIYLGMLAATIMSKVKIKLGVVLIVIGSVLFIISAFLSNLGFYLFNNEFDRLILFGLPATLIILGIASYEMIYSVKANKTLLLLGEASYSLYLIHLPFVAAFVKLYPKLNIQNDLIYHVLWVFLVLIICFISVKLYQIVELPLLKKLNNPLGKRRAKNLKVINNTW